ncbi:hypothetical protein XENTR_v10009561 [Xenopus tropicalis]|nr:hypothetical protein XENTR_v10009561 [Xenopus tropicalis]
MFMDHMGTDGFGAMWLCHCCQAHSIIAGHGVHRGDTRCWLGKRQAMAIVSSFGQGPLHHLYRLLIALYVTLYAQCMKPTYCTALRNMLALYK